MAGMRKPEEIVAKLRQVDGLVLQGQSVRDAVRSLGVTGVICFFRTLTRPDCR
jgi:putative transposase